MFTDLQLDQTLQNLKPKGATLSRRGAVVITAIVCAALLIIFGVTARTALDEKSATGDEPLHMAAAWVQTHFFDFRCNPEDPPLWKYFVAVGTNPDDLMIDRHSLAWTGMLGDLGKAVAFFTETFYRTQENNPDAVFAAGRTRMVFLGIALGAVIAVWSWRWGGAIAAIVATAAYSLDPNFLAHGALIKNDVVESLFFFSLMFAVWLMGERVTAWRWLAVSLLLGAGLTTKFSGILMIPMLGIALLIRAALPIPWPILKKTATTFWQKLGVAVGLGFASLIVSYACIWAAYGFRFEMSGDPTQHFDISGIMKTSSIYSSALDHDASADTTGAQVDQWSKEWRPDFVFKAGLWALDHKVLPQSWVGGFLYTYGTSHSRSTFLCDELRVTGWWYYFPAAMLFKTPLATLIGLAICTLLWCFWRIRKGIRIRESWPMLVALIAPTLYMIVAMKTHLNLGLRHVLPVYPFLFLFMGVVAAQAWRRMPKTTAVIAALLIVGLEVETFFAYPNFIPFFNVAFGGYRGGLHLLSDSNIDWGQDLPALKKWQEQHPDRTVCLFYFGAADPAYYGIKYYLSGSGYDSKLPDRREMAKMNPVIAISATELQETYTNDVKRKFWGDFRNSEPTAILGGSIYLYDLNSK